MRINRFIAQATGVSRRAADKLIIEGRVTINDQIAGLGADVTPAVSIKLDGGVVKLPADTTTILLNKPAGYICSRKRQGGKTVYDLFPAEYNKLKPVGRLDKDSSGLLLLTNDGALAQQLTHPKYQKEKVYEVELDKPLQPADKIQIEQGIKVEDYISRLQLKPLEGNSWQAAMCEGHNRQIRRTFASLGYTVTKLHRSRFGTYKLGDLPEGSYRKV